MTSTTNRISHTKLQGKNQLWMLLKAFSFTLTKLNMKLDDNHHQNTSSFLFLSEHLIGLIAGDSSFLVYKKRHRSGPLSNQYRIWGETASCRIVWDRLETIDEHARISRTDCLSKVLRGGQLGDLRPLLHPHQLCRPRRWTPPNRLALHLHHQIPPVGLLHRR